APINFDDRVEPRGVRLPHAPESSFGEFNHPILMADEIQAGVENKPIDRRRRRNKGWRVRRFVRRALCGWDLIGAWSAPVHEALFQFLPWLSHSRIWHLGHIRQGSSARAAVPPVCSYSRPFVVSHEIIRLPETRT